MLNVHTQPLAACVMLALLQLRAADAAPSAARSNWTKTYFNLDHLADKYGSDKVRTMHKYTDVYTVLLGPIRHLIQNITEIGIRTGASLWMWLNYFRTAHVHGIDLSLKKVEAERVYRNLSPSVRELLHLYEFDSRVPGACERHGLRNQTMDVVIDDGDHRRAGQEATFSQMWPLLKPGGYYIMEDVDAQRGGLDFRDKPNQISREVSHALRHNPSFLVDSHLGHPQWEAWRRKSTASWTVNHTTHNSYLLILMKHPQS